MDSSTEKEKTKKTMKNKSSRKIVGRLTFETTFRLIAVILTIASSMIIQRPAHAQALYVSDPHNDAVEAIEVTSGIYVGPFVHSSNDAEDYKITGPQGVIFG